MPLNTGACCAHTLATMRKEQGCTLSISSSYCADDAIVVDRNTAFTDDGAGCVPSPRRVRMGSNPHIEAIVTLSRATLTDDKFNT